MLFAGEYLTASYKTSSMQLLSLLTVATVLTTLAFACNYERITQDPNYAKIDKPKLTLTIPEAHGTCVAPNGDFAVVSWNMAGKVYMYHSCGKLMRVVDLTKQGVKDCGTFGDCAFTDKDLYVTDYTKQKVYRLSTSGKFLKVLVAGHQFMRVTACKNRLYFTTGGDGENVFVYDTNGKEIRRISVPGGHARGIKVGIDDNLHVSTWKRVKFGNKVHTYNLQGQVVDEATYKELHSADGLAMDTAGNLLIADHTKGLVYVYSPCGGAPIKVIKTGTHYSVDVDISNDGTVIVADSHDSKVFLY